MAKKDLGHCIERTETIVIEASELDNAKRTLTMLQKALERFLRCNYYNRKQYPEIALEIEEQINTLQEWIQDYQIYSILSSFLLQVGLSIKDMESKIGQLMALCKPTDGKKRIKKNSKFNNTMNFANQLMPCWPI